MADKLTYKGGKDVVNSVGGMKLVLPKGGGDFHRVPTWWSKKGTVTYTDAAIIKVPLDNGAAVVGADSLDIITEYQFARISGGPVLKRIVGSIPSADVAFATSTSISGTATVGETLTATAATYTGGVGSVTTNLLFQISDTGSGGWSFLAGNPGTAAGGTATYTIQAGDDTKYIRASYQVTDDNGTTSSNSSGVGPISTTFAQRSAAANFSYTVGVNNIGTAELPQNVYTLNGVDGPGIAFSVGDVVLFDFSAVASNHPLGLFTDST